MEGESGEQVGGELECDIVSRVFYARLTERDRKLIPEMRWCIVKWAIGDFREDVGGRDRMTTVEERVPREVEQWSGCADK